MQWPGVRLPSEDGPEAHCPRQGVQVIAGGAEGRGGGGAIVQVPPMNWGVPGSREQYYAMWLNTIRANDPLECRADPHEYIQEKVVWYVW